MTDSCVAVEIRNILDVVKYTDDLSAVIFDLDDTLYSEKEYVRSGYKKIAALFPQIKDAEERLWDLFQKKEPAIDEFLRQENTFSEELKEECLSVYRFQEPDVHLYTGMKEMLINLRKKHFLGLITDGRPEGQRAKIKALRLEKFFDYMIITDELGGVNYRKPNDKAYKLMAEKFGLNFNQMCYVGDNPKKDFIAPKQLGIRCIWFRNPDGLYQDVTQGMEICSVFPMDGRMNR